MKYIHLLVIVVLLNNCGGGSPTILKNGELDKKDTTNTLTCKIHGTVEKANKKCTKVKVRVAKITGPFGITVDEVCSYSTGRASAGELVWMPIN